MISSLCPLESRYTSAAQTSPVEDKEILTEYEYGSSTRRVSIGDYSCCLHTEGKRT